MMYVTMNDGKVFCAHIGQQCDVDPNNVVEVQVDCDELVKCCALTGMSNVNNRVIRWFGDHAKFIVANWQ